MMNDTAKTPLATPCRSCGAPVTGAYCGACGEKLLVPEHDLSLAALLKDAVGDLVNLDGKIWRSLKMLVVHPGELTLAWSEGRRRDFTKPIGLFIFVNALFFLTLSTGFMRWPLETYWQPGNDGWRADLVTQWLARSGETVEMLRVRYAIASSDAKKTFLLGAVPLFALVLWAIEAGRGRRLVEHLVFAIHAWTFYLLWWGFGTRTVFFVLILAIRAVRRFNSALAEQIAVPLSSEAALIALIMLAVVPWLVRALRTYYREPMALAVVRSLGLAATFQATIVIFRMVVFWIAMHTL